ncbi:MAG TPA: glycosyltransferase family 39 protein, partial [Candidatus Dormibacteraeota bacterium]|nr:glycosyltransferase family 39 protein [Candidatus Dormibacteraeota bacterium]
MASRSDVGVCERLRKLILAYPRSTLASLTLLALAPFLAKPFNMDDPLFIWAAKNLFDHPGNPYGFTVNWFGSATPMWDATKNPPLCSYYLSFFGEMFGWSEVALHGAMLLPASAAILGTFRLARRFCKNPFFAALVVLFTPAFLVSATTVMSDVLLLAFWIWAVVFWVERKDGHTRTGKPCLSGVLMGLAALTKYYGATLIPLLLCYELLKHRRVKLLYPLVIPVAVLIAYSWWTSRLYGR